MPYGIVATLSLKVTLLHYFLNYAKLSPNTKKKTGVCTPVGGKNLF